MAATCSADALALASNGATCLVEPNPEYSVASFQTVLADIMVDFEALFDGTTFRAANIFGAAIRAPFHDAAEYDYHSSDRMGPDGCLSQHPSNEGLLEADSILMSVIEPFWQRYCGKISRADFWVLLAKLSVERADPTDQICLPFHIGRKDKKNCNAGVGRVPDGQFSVDTYLQDLFVSRLQLTMHDAIALMGGHTVGHMHPEVSGYGLEFPDFILQQRPSANAWDATPARFDSGYYKSLVHVDWNNVRSAARNTNFWTVPGQSGGANQFNVMLNVDMINAFLIDISEDACTGKQQGVRELCSSTALYGAYGCRTLQEPLMDVPGFPAATGAQIIGYASGEEGNTQFLTDFKVAFTKMVTVGYTIDGVGPDGKLGALEAVHMCVLPTASPSGAPTVMPTLSDCLGPFVGFDMCEKKIQWFLDNKDSAWFARVNMDGSRCSIQQSLFNKGHCPDVALATHSPSTVPSRIPSVVPSKVPSRVPSTVPSAVRSTVPSTVPSAVPSTVPSAVTSNVPTTVPSVKPSTTAPIIAPVTAPVSVPLSGAYQQCGGVNWQGPTACVAGYTCDEANVYYNQCRPITAQSMPGTQSMAGTRSSAQSASATIDPVVVAVSFVSGIVFLLLIGGLYKWFTSKQTNQGRLSKFGNGGMIEEIVVVSDQDEDDITCGEVTKGSADSQDDTFVVYVDTLKEEFR